MDDLTKTATSQLSPQCIAAHAMVKYCLQYVEILPSKVFNFVPWHQSDIGFTIHCMEDLMVTNLELDSSVTNASYS